MSIDWYRLLIVSNQDLRASEEQEEQQQHKNQQQEEEGVEEGGDEGGEEGGEHGGEHGEQEEREEGEEKELGEGLPPIPLTALGKISKANTRRALIAAGHTSHGGFPCAGCAASRSPNSCPTNPHVCDFHRHFDVAACVSYQ